MDFLKNVEIFAVFLAITAASALLILCYVLILPYKLFVLLVAKLFRSDLGALVTNESAYFNDKPINRSIITNFWVLQGQLTLQRLTKLVAERIVEKRGPDGKYVFQRLREYIFEFMGFDFWRTDTDFSVSNHVMALSMNSVLTTGLSPAGMSFDEKLEKLTSTVVGYSNWSRQNQSQWEMFPVSFPKEGRTVLVTRVHHTLADGFSHRFLFECLFQYKLAHQPPTSPPTRIIRDLLSSPRALLLYPLRMLLDTAETAHMLLRDRNTNWHYKDLMNLDCVSAYSKPVRIQDIKRLRRQHGVDYNTVVFLAVAKAFTRVMQEAGQELPPYSSLIYLGNKNDHPKIPTNHFNPCYMPLPSRDDTTLQELNRHVLSSKQNLFGSWIEVFCGKILFSLPTPFRKLLGFLGVDPTMLVSTFMPYEVPEFDGHQILDFVAFVGYRACRAGNEMLVTGAFDLVRFQLVLSKTIAPDEMSAKRIVNYAYEEVQKMISE